VCQWHACLFKHMKKKSKLFIFLLAPFLIVVLFYELLPLSQLVLNSFLHKKDHSVTLEYYIRIFTTPVYLQAIRNSLRISLISALIGLVVAFFAGKAYSESDGKLKQFFYLVLNMTSNFSGVPLTFAFMILMGNTGVLTLLLQKSGMGGDFNLYSGNGLLLIYIYFQIPLATLLLLPSFLGLKKEWREAATILNASSFSYWWKVGIPNLLPSILGTLSVLFANALAAYATAYALILNNYALLSLQISSKFKGDVKIDKQMGGALAVVLILFMVLSTLFNNYLTKRSGKGRSLV